MTLETVTVSRNHLAIESVRCLVLLSLLAVTLPGAAAGIWWLYYPTWNQEVLWFPASMVMGGAALLLVWGPVAAWNRFARGPELAERMSRQVSMQVLFLPFVAAAGSCGLSLGLAGFTLTLGDASPVPTAYRVLFIEVVVFAVLAMLGAPWVALAQIHDEATGDRVSLLDNMAPVDAVAASIASEWTELRTKRRRWATIARVEALGTPEAEAPIAWPSQWPGDSRWQRATAPRRIFSVSAAACAVAIATFVAMSLIAPSDGSAARTSHWAAFAAVVLLAMGAPALGLGAMTYATTLKEQNRAQLLRAARARLEQRRALEQRGAEDPAQGAQVTGFALARALVWIVADLLRRSRRCVTAHDG